MKYWLSLGLFLIGFQLFSKTDYERALQLFEEADSIIAFEFDKKDRNHNNYRLAVSKLERSRDLFNRIDSTYFGFRCEVGILRCKEVLRELDLEVIKELQARIIHAGVKDSLLGRIYYFEGAAYSNLLMNAEAAESFGKAIGFLQQSNYLIPLINCHWYLGYSYYRIQEIEKHLKHYEQAIDLLLKLPYKSRFKLRSLFYLKLSLLKTFMARMDFESFVKCYEFCSQILLENPSWFDFTHQADLEYELARGSMIVGNYEKARTEFERVLTLDPSALNYIGLDMALNSLGQMEEAISRSKKYLRQEGNDIIKSKLLNNIGYSYSLLEKYDSAKLFYQRAIDLNLSMGNERSLGINMENLGEIFMKEGEYKLADSLLHSGLQYKSENDIGIHCVLSKNYYMQGDFDYAIKFSRLSVFDDSGNLVNQIRGNSFEQRKIACRWMLTLLERLFYKTNEDQYLNESLFLVDKLVEDFRQKLLQYNNQSSTLSQMVHFVYDQGVRNSLTLAHETDSSKYLNKAFQFSEWSKVHSLQRAKQSSKAKFLAGLPEAVIDKERNLKIDENYFRSQLAKYKNELNIDSNRVSRYQKRLSVIGESQDSLQNHIRINYPRYHQLRYQDITLSVEEVQDRLKPSQAFVEYYEGDTTSFVFTITKDDYQVQRIHLDDDTLISTYRKYFEPEHFQRDQKRVNQFSYQIYQNYLEPAIGSLDSSITELIVVPDGKLSYVPFDILLTKPVHEKRLESVPHLLRDYQVHYTYSASLYFNDFTTLSTKNQYLAFAPEYETTLTDTTSINRLGNFRSQVTPLKHNQEEVSYIADHFKGLGYVGSSANERNFKEKVDEYGVLHLAMHTIVDDEDPMNSKLIFANSKDSLEDDMLHAFEIYNMEIPSQLAVLSACETGFGQLAKGEGALSLARAFSYAGSPSVVMSHWPVDDQTTAELMKSFYDYLADGLTKSDALRKAKLDFLDRTHSARVHPFFWGSFVVMGDDAPVQIQRQPVVNPVWIALLCLIVVVALGTFVAKYEL